MGKSRRTRKKKKLTENHDHDAAVAITRREEDEKVSGKSGEKRKHTISESSSASSPTKRPKQEAEQSSNEKEETSFPYPTDPDDHCESPIDSYQDILPLLRFLRGSRQPNDFKIYDPYFCDGAVKENFKKLGFPNVYNQKEDCYSIWSNATKYPDFDAFVTNPPYSGDHIEKLMTHVTSKEIGDRPWFLLMPNWVHKKDYFLARTKGLNPFFLVPRKRYVYIPPQNFRESKKSDVHKKSSPFVSMWYIYGGNEATNNKLIQHFIRSESANSCELARSKSALRDLRRKKR